MGREGGDAWASGAFYKLVLQANVLFGSYTWAMNPRIGQTLGVLRHRVTCRLVGMQPRRGTTGRCEYPPLEAYMAAADLEEVEIYVLL